MAYRIVIQWTFPPLTASFHLHCLALIPLAKEPGDLLQPPAIPLLTRTGLFFLKILTVSMALGLKRGLFDDDCHFLSVSMEEVPTAAPLYPPERTKRSKTWWVRRSSPLQQAGGVGVVAPQWTFCTCAASSAAPQWLQLGGELRPWDGPRICPPVKRK